jgi:hypothetical protein
MNDEGKKRYIGLPGKNLVRKVDYDHEDGEKKRL